MPKRSRCPRATTSLMQATARLDSRLPAEALALAAPHVGKHPDDPRGLDLLVEIAFELGDEELFLRQAQAWKRLTGKEHRLFTDYLREVEEGHELSADCMALSASALNTSRE